MKSRIPESYSQRTQKELHEDSKTLRYELSMLVSSVSRFCDPSTQNDLVMRNISIESFAVHCRAIIFFLYGHLEQITANGKVERFARIRPNDILAFHYCPTWKVDCPKPTEVLIQAKWQADKHVAHITTDRRGVNQPGSPKKSSWKLGEAATDICDVFSQFLSKTPSQQFETKELQSMNNIVKSWRLATFPPRRGDLQMPLLDLSASSQSLTDARTLTPHPCYKMQGKTE